jgi:hypothetical protein
MGEILDPGYKPHRVIIAKIRLQQRTQFPATELHLPSNPGACDTHQSIPQIPASPQIHHQNLRYKIMGKLLDRTHRKNLKPSKILRASAVNRSTDYTIEGFR